MVAVDMGSFLDSNESRNDGDGGLDCILLQKDRNDRPLNHHMLNEKWLLAVILAAFVALATYYSAVTPLGEAPDEVPHYQFARYLSLHHSLPLGDEAGSEGFQPPLYYAMGALLTFWVPEGDYVVKANADFSLGRPETSKSVLLHTRAESFPYQGGVLAWHLIRLLSVALGAVTVLMTFGIARETFPKTPSLALGAAAVNAFLPGFVFISAAANNDNLVTTLSAAATLQAIRVAKGRTGWLSNAVLGLLIGLAVLAKISALILLPLAVLAVLVAAWQSQLDRRAAMRCAVSRLALVCLLVAAVAGWWFVRNQVVHGDLLGWQFKLNISDVRQAPPSAGDWLHLVQGLFTSYWGRFGGAVQLRMPATLYLMLAALSALAIAGNVLYLVRLWRRQSMPPVLSAAVLLGALVLLLGGSFVRWSTAVLGTDQARLLFPAVSVSAILIAGGLSELLRRWRPFVLGSLGIGLFLLAIATPSLFIVGAFASPPAPTQEELIAAGTPDDIVFAGDIRLMGSHLDADARPPGQDLAIDLYWEALERPDGDYWLTIELLNRDGTVVAAKDGAPSAGAVTTDLWRPGQRLASRHYLLLPATTVPGRYEVRLSLHRFGETKPALLTVSGRNQTEGEIVIGDVRVGERGEAIPLAGQVGVGAAFGPGITLISYGLAGEQDGIYAPGSAIRVALRWRREAGALPPTDYTVFVHLVDHHGKLESQADAQPRGGRYPTSIWVPGDTVDDQYTVPVPKDAPPGEYMVMVGLYEATTGQRLPAVGSDGRMVGDQVLLQRVQVK